jgi:hypothetical protein
LLDFFGSAVGFQHGRFHVQINVRPSKRAMPEANIIGEGGQHGFMQAKNDVCEALAKDIALSEQGEAGRLSRLLKARMLGSRSASDGASTPVSSLKFEPPIFNLSKLPLIPTFERSNLNYYRADSSGILSIQLLAIHRYHTCSAPWQI